MIQSKRIRVLYSFPHKIGADRICYTAWQQVNGLAAAGAEILVMPGVIHKPLPPNVQVWPTLSWGKLRISYKILGGMRALAIHDYLVSKRLPKLLGKIDIIHTWPSGALLTLKMAKHLGIPTVLERPNAHTRFAYTVVQQECERLGLTLPHSHEHTYKANVLKREEEEFNLAYRLLCPSDFVMKTFLEKGFEQEKLLRHQYGYDEQMYYPCDRYSEDKDGITMLFVGGCAPRKGLHYALEAWLKSKASRTGNFYIAGRFVPGYAEKLKSMLIHPSVKVLGHRKDVPDLMRKSDILILPTIEEGSALVTYEARGSGCVLLVSEAAGAMCRHMENALVHRVGDVEMLTRHINMLHEDRSLLKRLREASLSTSSELTWSAAGIKLLQLYEAVIASKTKE